MVIVRLVGGLGNQLFQYTCGRVLSLRTHDPLLLDVSAFKDYKLRPYALSPFKIVSAQASSEQIAKYTRMPSKWLFWKSPKLYREPHFEFDQKVMSMKPPVYLDGYWQSEKYFTDASEQIRKDLQIIPSVANENHAMFEQVQRENSVSMHIRRGDYVSNPSATQVHGVLGLDYYHQAMQRIRQKLDHPKFFVFSDDQAWVKENFGESNDIFYSTNTDSDKAYEDLRLMSACKSHIIANSTFSWWGAWLNPSLEKTVIAPKQWFAGGQHNDKDLIPITWERI